MTAGAEVVGGVVGVVFPFSSSIYKILFMTAGAEVVGGVVGVVVVVVVTVDGTAVVEEDVDGAVVKGVADVSNVVFPVSSSIYKILFLTADAEVVGGVVGVVVVVMTVDGTAVVEKDVDEAVVKGVADISSRQLIVLVAREVQSAKMRQYCCSSR